MHIRPATLRDVSFIMANLRELDTREVFCQLPDGTKPAVVAAHSVSAGEAWTAFYKGMPTAAFGFQPVSDGVLVGWAYGRVGIERCIPAITRFVFKTKVPEWLREGIRRIEVRTIETHVLAHRWLEAAGAKRVCTLPQWGRDGQTFLLYAWVRGDVPGQVFRRWSSARKVNTRPVHNLPKGVENPLNGGD